MTKGSGSQRNRLVSSRGGTVGKGDNVCTGREKLGVGGEWIILDDGTLPRKKREDIIKSGPVLMTRTCYCLSPLQVQVPHFEGKAVVKWRTDCDNQHEFAQTHTQVAKQIFVVVFFCNARLGSSFTWQKIKLYNLRVQICGKVHMMLLYLLLNAVEALFSPPFRWKTMT